MSYEDYEYTDDPSTWFVRRPPERPVEFERALAQLGGMNPHGKPNLRLVWGGTEREEFYSTWSLKYPLGLTEARLIGFEYHDPQSGWTYRDALTGAAAHVRFHESIPPDSVKSAKPVLTFVSDKRMIPDGTLCLPRHEQEELGQLRWMIERYVSPAQLKHEERYLPRYTHDPETGERITRDFPREGCFDHYLTIETDRGKFRMPDATDLTVIAEGLYTERVTTRGERKQMRRDRRREQEKTKSQAFATRRFNDLSGSAIGGINT